MAEHWLLGSGEYSDISTTRNATLTILSRAAELSLLRATMFCSRSNFMGALSLCVALLAWFLKSTGSFRGVDVYSSATARQSTTTILSHQRIQSKWCTTDRRRTTNAWESHRDFLTETEPNVMRNANTDRRSDAVRTHNFDL
jgi:hypothetical protein